MRVSFVYPFWQGGANYDELRWSIRSIFKNFIPDNGMQFDVWIIGDQPVLKREDTTWYNGNIVLCPRITEGTGFNRKLQDALNKWNIALRNSDISSTIVWMMDDIFFIKPITLKDLITPRATKYKNENSLNRWIASSGFSKAKLRSMKFLISNGLSSWDFATHLPHVVDKELAINIFDNFPIQNKEESLLWEVIYENTYLGQAAPQKLVPFSRYLSSRPTDSQIQEYHNNPDTKVLISTGYSWNENVRRFLYTTLQEPAPIEADNVIPPIPVKASDTARIAKAIKCPHRKKDDGNRKGVIYKELPVWYCDYFKDNCTIDQYTIGQTERTCVTCPLTEINH